MCSPSREPVAGKCEESLQQEDITFPNMKLCDTLSMVGVELTANWLFTRKVNNDELQKRVNSCIGAQC